MERQPYNPSLKYGYNVPGQSADELQKSLTSEQFEDYKARFAEREIEFINAIKDGSYFGNAPEQAGQLAADNFGRQREISDRAKERYGAQVTPMQEKLMMSLRKHGGSLARTQAENTTRDAIDAQRLEVLSQLTNIGRGIRTSVNTGAASAASLEAQRRALNQQLSAQRHAGQYAGAAAGAIGGYALGGALSAAKFAGPVGAVLGGIAGFLFG